VVGGSGNLRKVPIRAGVNMREIIDLTGVDTVDTLPAVGRGRILLNNRQGEMDRRQIQQRANRKKKIIYVAKLRQFQEL